uniref:Elongator complex protein 2 n=1 Tax=Globisporangium ultimum (strain ATCC 200006 / CBS 805.95 / DAOM BR144) TaxID=431595 RepID=K3XAA3_GLOUD
MACAVELAHVFVGANAISNAFCANAAASAPASCACTAFAAKNAVALVARDPQSAELLQITQTLKHGVAASDSARISSVFLHSTATDERVLAGDSEGNVFLWQREKQREWELCNLSFAEDADAKLKLSSASVAAVTAAQTSVRWVYFVSFSDGKLVVFEQHKQQGAAVSVLAQVDLGVKCIMESLATTVVGLSANGSHEQTVLVAAGGVDSKVYLYEVHASTFKQLMALEGHRGWIRGLAFEKQQRALQDGPTSFFLASASQDQRIRLWKITADKEKHSPDVSQSAATTETRDGFQAAGATASYTVSFDALLIGHEDWVTSLEWTLVAASSGDAGVESALVSSSMDNTLIVWTKNMQLSISGAWYPSLRIGEIGGNGILSGIVLPSEGDRLDLLALNFSGQLERWKQQPSPSKIFLPAVSLTGHCASVTDLSWSPSGDYMLSVSLDQTARVFAPLKKKDQSSWHEISRAQVHGYDLNCACFLLGDKTSDERNKTNDRFVSGADEKILRVFEAPDDIQSLVHQLAGAQSSDEDANPDDNDDKSRQSRVQNAYLPELSLTNKIGDTGKEKSVSRGGYATVNADIPALRVPVGDTLGKKTLWPEQRKLYGHGNELLCVASNHAGTLIASACKSREERFASIWLWSTSDWSVAQTPLEGHKSSVVQLAFSPNDQFLVSVSRDRQFCVYEKNASDHQFALVDKLKAHKRIIWSCSWSPDSRYFATASRDQSFALWTKTGTKWGAASKPVVLEGAVTAVAFAPHHSQEREPCSYVVAVGLESGTIHLYAVVASGEAVECKLLTEVGYALSPSATVTRLAWSPSCVDDRLVLAAASSDYSVRLYNVAL